MKPRPSRSNISAARTTQTRLTPVNGSVPLAATAATDPDVRVADIFPPGSLVNDCDSVDLTVGASSRARNPTIGGRQSGPSSNRPAGRQAAACVGIQAVLTPWLEASPAVTKPWASRTNLLGSYTWRRAIGATGARWRGERGWHRPAGWPSSTISSSRRRRVPSAAPSFVRWTA